MNIAHLQARQDDNPVGSLVGNLGTALLGAVVSKVADPVLNVAGDVLSEAADDITPAVSD